VLLIAGTLGLSGYISNNFTEKVYMKRIDTEHAIVKFNDEDTVPKFADDISYNISLLEGLRIEDEERIVRSVDNIIEKTEFLLEMEKDRENKFTINVYDTERSLKYDTKLSFKEAYCQAYKYCSSLRAWYSFHLNTVFCTVEDIDPSLLAHELGHAIIDDFFGFEPPRKSVEILSKYVDTHLYD